MSGAARIEPRPRWRALRVLLPLTSLLLVGLHPFAYTSLATSFDGLLHLYRVVELDHLLRQGVLYPRWAPDFVFGFGYPIFNYYAPLAYYFSLVIHALGVSYVDTATIFFIACTLAAALGMYALARELTGSGHAALIAALAYAYAPTHIYDNFYRSAWSTVLAYALAPLVFWALRRWHATGAVRHLAGIALGVAALMLAHNVSALLFMPLVGMAAVLFAARGGPGAPRRGLARMGSASAAVALGLGMSAFFWLPAIGETGYVQTWRLVIPPDFDFRNHFLSPADWFAWPAPAEAGRINPDLVNTLGPVQFVLAGLGIIVMAYLLVRQSARARSLVPFGLFGAGLIVSLWMTLPQSEMIWEAVPLLPSLQFPHRFVTLAALCAALLGALAIAQVPNRWQPAASLVVSVLVVLSSIPFLYPRPQPPTNPEPGLADALAHEHRTGALGTTASGEYLPVAVRFVPRSSAFEEAIANGENPQRFESRTLPAGGKVLAQEAGPLSSALTVSSSEPFTATFRQFYFPGWQGSVDGRPVATSASDGQGLTVFAVPAGTHRIELAFASTPLRDLATLISVIASIAGAAIGLAMVTRRKAMPQRSDDIDPMATACPSKLDELRSGATFALLGMLLLVFKVAIADRYDTPFRVTFDGLHVPTLQYSKPVRLSSGVTWLGYTLPITHATAGATLDLTLYWKAERDIGTVYSAFAQLVDEQSNLYAQKDNLHPGGAPTTTWRGGEFDVDRHTIDVPAATPPGRYWLSVGLYDPRNGARLLRENSPSGEPVDQVIIGPVRIDKALAPPSLTDLRIQHPLGRATGAGLRLLGYSLDKDRLPSDDFLRVAIFWQAERAPLPELRMRLRLIDSEGREFTRQESAPSNDRYPTTAWGESEIVRDNRALWLPATLAAGAYRLQLQVDGESEWSDLSVLRKP